MSTSPGYGFKDNKKIKIPLLLQYNIYILNFYPKKNIYILNNIIREEKKIYHNNKYINKLIKRHWNSWTIFNYVKVLRYYLVLFLFFIFSSACSRLILKFQSLEEMESYRYKISSGGDSHFVNPKIENIKEPSNLFYLFIYYYL